MRIVAMMLTAGVLLAGSLPMARGDDDDDWRDALRDQEKWREEQLEETYERQRDQLKHDYERRKDQLKYQRDRFKHFDGPARRWHERDYDRRRDQLERVYDRQKDQLKLDYKSQREALEDHFEHAGDWYYHHPADFDARLHSPLFYGGPGLDGAQPGEAIIGELVPQGPRMPRPDPRRWRGWYQNRWNEDFGWGF